MIQLAAAGTVDLTGADLRAIDEFRGTSGDDTFLLTGVAEAQRLTGLGGADTLSGGDGNDVLDGGAGDDTLSGSNGADQIIGGLGRDTMTGGADADRFIFNDLAESGTGPAGRDVIADFLHGQDLLDLVAIDANTEVAGNQAFTFIGSAGFSGAAGELRYAGSVVSADVDGDGSADFQIRIANGAGLTAADFLL
jgi:Ca2+-binding RTX toxin-like protein